MSFNILLEANLSHTQINSFLMEYEAIKIGLKTERINHLLLLCYDNQGNSAVYRRASGPGQSMAAEIISMNKDYMKRIWDLNGIPNNHYIALAPGEFKLAVDFCKSHNWDIVLKPADSFGGRNVYVAVDSVEQLEYYWKNITESQTNTPKAGPRNNILINKKILAKY